jgi:hypothetical protein
MLRPHSLPHCRPARVRAQKRKVGIGVGMLLVVKAGSDR